MTTKSLILTSLLILPATLPACDLCGCALVTHHDRLPQVGFYTGVNEQFTRYTTLQEDGHAIDNDARQKLDSSITQIFLGYNVTPRFGVQVNVPFIRRVFRRPEETGIDSGSVGGVGDVSLLANWLPLFHQTNEITFSLKLTGGLKFPTGDSDRVKEEGAEGHEHGAAEEPGAHHEEGEAHEGHNPAEEESGEGADDHSTDSGIHGHDLALGTGSVDGIVGGGIYVRWKSVFFSGDVQYAIRGDGKHDYDFANDFLWSGGPGIYLIDRATHRVAVQFVCTGETKGEDEFRGTRSDDTSATTVFLGPKIGASWHDRLTADVELDIPVSRENSGVQIMPDYRLRATISWSF